MKENVSSHIELCMYDKDMNDLKLMTRMRMQPKKIKKQSVKSMQFMRKETHLKRDVKLVGC
jgi:hypothetical protein